MRKASSILLLIVFFLYHIGYYVIYLSSWYQIELMWENKMENDSLDESRFQLKSLPLSLPYQYSQEHFQSVSAKVEIEGKLYRVVKQRYAKDTLHIIYVKDLRSEDLNEAFNKFVSFIAQQPATEDGGKVVLNLLIKNYLPHYFDIVFITKWVENGFSLFLNSCFKSSFTSVAVPPPKSLL